MPAEIYNIYGDESCHLEHDGQKVMCLGAVICPTRYVDEVNHELKQLKKKHGMPESFELKWTKVGKSKLGYYADVIDLFVRHKFLRLRGHIIDKSAIDHSKVSGQTHAIWYYKMYYKMLKPVVEDPMAEFRIYVDIKDTHGYERVRELRRILCKGIRDCDETHITRVQEVHSDEVELLQLADLLLGALVYENRGELASPPKIEVLEMLKDNALCSGLDRSVSRTRYATASAFVCSRRGLRRRSRLAWKGRWRQAEVLLSLDNIPLPERAAAPDHAEAL